MAVSIVAAVCACGMCGLFYAVSDCLITHRRSKSKSIARIAPSVATATTATAKLVEAFEKYGERATVPLFGGIDRCIISADNKAVGTADTNKDGVLDTAEISAMVANRGYKVPAEHRYTWKGRVPVANEMRRRGEKSLHYRSMLTPPGPGGAAG